LRIVYDVKSSDGGSTFGRLYNSGEHAQNRCLTSSVGAQEPKDSPGLGFDVNSVYRLFGAGFWIVEVFFESVSPNHHRLYGIAGQKGASP